MTKQITKKYFNKRLIMTSEDEEIYNNSHICWICKQEINTDKVKDQVKDSLQFYNSLLDTLASNLNDEVFKYLVSEFGIDKLEILKRKDAYPYKWVDLYEKFKHSSLLEKKCFYSSLRDGKRDNSDGHITKCLGRI